MVIFTFRSLRWKLFGLTRLPALASLRCWAPAGPVTAPPSPRPSLSSSSSWGRVRLYPMVRGAAFAACYLFHHDWRWGERAQIPASSSSWVPAFLVGSVCPSLPRLHLSSLHNCPPVDVSLQHQIKAALQRRSSSHNCVRSNSCNKSLR